MAKPDVAQPRMPWSGAVARRFTQVRPWLGFIVTVPLLLLGVIVLTLGTYRQTHRQFTDDTFMDCAPVSAEGAAICVRSPTIRALVNSHPSKAAAKQEPRFEPLPR
jgi:hypothetical protein